MPPPPLPSGRNQSPPVDQVVKELLRFNGTRVWRRGQIYSGAVWAGGVRSEQLARGLSGPRHAFHMIPQPPPGQGPIDPRGAFTPPPPPGNPPQPPAGGPGMFGGPPT